MADFNLSAEVSMDVDPLKASKTTIERNLKAINKSLRDQRKEMKQNEVSAESLAKQETDLGRAIKLQEGLMAQRNKELQDQQKEMAKSNEVTDEQKIKLQNLNAAYEKSKKQLNGYQDELNSVQVKQKTFGKTTDDVKKNLNELRNEVKKSQIEFEKSSKATSDYERHIDSLTGSLNKSEKQLGQLDDNLKIISDLKGENSREAKELRGEISKEQLAFKQLELQLSKTKTSFNDYKQENSESAIAMRKLDDAIDNTKNSITQLSNSLRQSNAEFNKSSKESDDYKNHLRNLTNTQTRQIQIINELEDEYNQVSLSQGKASQQAQDLKNEIAKQNISFTNLKNQIDNTTNEYDEFRLENSETNLTLGEAKRRLEDMNNELKISSLKFKQSEKTADDYKAKISQLKATMTQQSAVLTGLNRRYDEVKHAQGENSVAAKNLRNDIAKETLAFQVLQGRIDETTDELKEYQRQQRLMGTATNAWVGARQQMDRIATTLRSLGELTQGVVGGVMTTHFSALVPILGSVVSLGAGLGGMLTAAAGGAIGMGGAFGIAGVAVKAFAGQATYALKMLEDGQLRVTKEVSAYQTALSGLKSSWEGLIAQNQAAIFNTMTNGINTAKYALTTLNPFLTKTATQIETASGKMLNWAKTSSVAKRSFDILNTQGPKIFQHLLNATQSFVNGSAALFNKLSPLYGWAAKGFANMAKSFDNWANSVEGSKAINGFIEYTKANLPIVGNIFGNIFKGIISLFQAFSGHSHNVLLGIQDVTKGFAEWSEGLKKSDGFQQFVQYLETNGPKVWSLIKNITGTLWGLVKGMAPVGAVVLSMSNAFFKWTNEMTNAHPMIGKILGVLTALGGVALLAAKPILLLRGALLGATGATKLFGNAGAIAAIKTNVAKTATKLWTGTITLLSTAMKVARGQLALQTVLTGKYSLATKLAAVASRGLGLAIRFMTGPIGWVITVIGLLVAGIVHLWKTNATFRNIVISVWQSVQNKIMSVVGFITSTIRTNIPLIKLIFSNTFNGVRNIVKGSLNVVMGIARVFSGLFTGNFRKMWSGVQQIFSGFIRVIKGIFQVSFVGQVINLARIMGTRIKTIFSNLGKVSRAIFTALGTWMSKKWSSIKNNTVGKAKLLWSGVKAWWSNLGKNTRATMNSIGSFMSKKWQSIKSGTVNKAKLLWSGVKNWWSNLNKNTRATMNSVGNFMSKKWQSIKSGTVNKAKSTWSGVKNWWSNLSKNTRATMNSVGKFMSSKWSSIKSNTVNRAKNTWSGVKGAWSSLSKGTRSTMNSVGSFMSNKWRGIKNSTVNLVTGMKNKITGVMNKMGDAIKSVTGKIKGFFSGMIGKVKSGLNKLISGVNWVGGKLGMDKLPKIKLHTGTEHTNTTTNVVKNGKIARDTFATVGDKGRGNGPNGFRHEAIRYPNGKMALTPNKDTTAYLPKGSSVMNGAQTHAMLSANNPTFSKGTLPRFANGTTGWDMLGGGGSKPKKHKKDDNLFGDMMSGAKSGAEALQGKVVKGGKAVVNKTLETAAKGKKWLGDKVGDVMDWIEKPGKLLKKVLEGFGVSMKGFGIPKAASLPYDMMKGMFGKLKKAATDLFTSWMEEQGGDGGYIDLSKGINFGFYKTAAQALAAGYPFASAHHGIDVNYKTGDKLYSTVSGTATAKHDNSGFGKHMWIKSGIMDVIYGHMSKFAFTGSKKVKPGTYLGESGNTGRSSGPHLHYEMRKNGVPFDPRNWLKKNNGGGGKSGKWNGDIKKALKIAGLPTSGAYVKAWQKQIQTESGGNPKAMGGTDGLADGRAKGLVQVKPGTFNAYKAKGHGNIWNGLDNLIAGMRYAKARYGKGGMLSVIGKGHGYATGTNNARRGYNQVFEKGGEIMQMRGGETVIPNDVSIQAFKQIATSDIFSRTQSAVYDAISQYADQLREKQQMATREQMELQRINRENADIKEQNGLLKQLLGKMDALLNSNQNIEGYSQQIRDKEYFPSSREMTKMNNENMALNAATQLMR
ncbi:peptidoglycan DD-metalloendopeptidase family protein [Staphylococcus cohnii]|uniref:peptidoglycan DD-metalloendopeptidase family protein n=1 Tax=Staphylococcus cohnii TaxID=29382 RepID=UPI002551C506|nr:peptidoglycan DD-metalloendopeptidase family protein [Staphylococcus cohnii]WIL68918.1 peptidoglycan DD-metalloendopeptidase family protein [Staphylococcus cohnii]